MDVLSKIILPGSVCYLLITILSLFFNDYSISFFMPLLPIIYGIVFALVYSYSRDSFKSMVVLLIFSAWFLRIVLIPFIYIISGYVSHISVYEGIKNLNGAAILMSYEFLAVGFLILLSKDLRIVSANDIANNLTNNKAVSLFTSVIVFLIFCFAMICFMLDNSVIYAISTIFDKIVYNAELNVERRREILDVYKNSKIVYSLFFNTVYYLQILIPASMLSFVIAQKKSTQSKKGLLWCLLIVLGSVIITTDNNIDSVCIMSASFIVVVFEYKEAMKNKVVPLGLLGIVFIFIYLFKKCGMNIDDDSSFFSSISPTFCAYFASPPNVSAGFSIFYENKLATFFGDIVAGVPYLVFFFKGLPKTVTLYNEVVHGYTGEVNQIVPLITSGFHYLGVFAPAFTLIVYSIAFKMEKYFQKSKTTFFKVILAVVMVNLSIGPCIFGFPNTIKRLCMFLPIFALGLVNERLLLKK